MNKEFFTIIKESDTTTRAMDGFNFKTETIELNESIIDWSDNRWCDEKDSFYDGHETLCRGKDGKIYLVEFAWFGNHEPLIWCEVEDIKSSVFEVGDLVKIKPEFLNEHETESLVYRVVDVNTITNRYYIEIAESNLPLNPQELVGFDMIQKA